MKPERVLNLGSLFLFLRLLLLTWYFSVNLPYWDQWDFLGPIFNEEGPLRAFFYQHGPHRQGVGGLLQWLLMRGTYWDMRIESLLCVAFVGCALWLGFGFLKKHRGRLSVWDIGIALLFLRGTAWEAYISTPNLAHGPLPLFFVILVALLLQRPATYARGFLLGILSFFSMFTGFALFVPPVLSLVLILERAWKKNLLALSLIFLSLWLFLSRQTFQPAAECFVFPDHHPLKYFSFSFAEFATVGGFYGVKPPFLLFLACTFGAALTGVVLSTLIRQRKNAALSFLFLFTLAFVAFSAVGRVCLGTKAAMSSRYFLYLIPAVLGVWCCLEERLKKIAVLLLLVTEMTLVPFYFRKVPGLMHSRGTWVQCYREHRETSLCDKETGIQIYPDSHSPAFLERLKKFFNRI